jgi:hypothetical protein
MKTIILFFIDYITIVSLTIFNVLYIENLYTKLMGNNHIQNLDFFLSSSCLMQLAAPFIQKSLALRRVDSI